MKPFIRHVIRDLGDSVLALVLMVAMWVAVSAVAAVLQTLLTIADG